jgi:formate-dependent nitrite reductase membrane component NrfD
MENIFYALLATYIVILVFLLIVIDLTKPGNFFKVLFWPIIGLIYFIAIIFGISVYVIRNIYKGAIVCFEEFKELFIDIWYAGEGED